MRARITPCSTVRIYSADTGRELVALRGHSGKGNSAVFSPDGGRVLTASDDRTARVWDAAAGKQLVLLRGHESGIGAYEQALTLGAFSPDGRRAVAGDHQGTARLWDAASGEQLVVWKGPRDHVLSAAFSRDGRWMLVAPQPLPQVAVPYTFTQGARRRATCQVAKLNYVAGAEIPKRYVAGR
jgi:WD40 repeat protein